MKKNSIAAVIIGFLLGSITMCIYGYFLVEEKLQNVNSMEKIVTVNDTGISEGINNIYDAVVVVENYKNSKLNGIGSGFIFDSEGYIITNQHVIDKADEVKIQLSDSQVIPATVIGGDEYADIAVVKIEKKFVKKIAKIGNSESMKLGDTVFTIGSPMSSDYSGTVTRGILSGKNRLVEVSVNSSLNDWIMSVMQTDAAINPGNSGGPLCNVSGEVIGVNSMKIVEDEIEGIGFAIPVEDAIKFANQVISGEDINRAYLGISMSDTNTSKYYLKKYGIEIDSSITSGVIVMDVDKKGPCYDAGILKGDVIIGINDLKISNVAELRYNLYKFSPNEKITIKIIRKTEEMTFEVLLGESK